jgi:hypothetical protein
MPTFATANARLPRPRRLLESADVTCPAGTVARGGEAVLCRVVDEVIDLRTDPTSIRNYCIGCYTECPIKQEDRKRHERGTRFGLEPLRG